MMAIFNDDGHFLYHESIEATEEKNNFNLRSSRSACQEWSLISLLLNYERFKDRVANKMLFYNLSHLDNSTVQYGDNDEYQ